MRYTKYNHNNNRRGGGRRGGNNFFLAGLAICIPLAIGIGMIFGPMIFKQGEGDAEGTKKPPVTDEGSGNKKDENINPPPVEKEDKGDKKEEGIEKETFFIVQCGVYGKEENAKNALKEIPEEFNKFVSKEGDKFKVIAGIYKEEKAKEKVEALSKEKIESAKIKTEIPKNTEDGVKTSKIINGYIDILEKFENKDTKSVNLEEFKKWTDELKGATDNEGEEVKKLKEHINALPKILERKDIQKSVEFLYNILNKYRV